MPTLRVLSGREVCRIMACRGFVQARRKGSHIIMQKKEGGTTITVPVPDHKELKKGTLLGIIRQSGYAPCLKLAKSLFRYEGG